MATSQGGCRRGRNLLDLMDLTVVLRAVTSSSCVLVFFFNMFLYLFLSEGGIDRARIEKGGGGGGRGGDAAGCGEVAFLGGGDLGSNPSLQRAS